MTRTELNALVEKAATETFEKSQDAIYGHLRSTLCAGCNEGEELLDNSIAPIVALLLTLVPSLSAAVTARLLEDLGLVSVEDRV